MSTEFTPKGFDVHYGLEFDEITPERVLGHVPVRPEILQPYGLVHGGVFASIAESLASVGTAVGVMPDGNLAVGLSNQTSFLRPLTTGKAVHATATRLHRGRTTWVWDVQMTDDDGRLCAISRMTIAVRPREAG
jgi:uncharacterized protein (TIGR00369 family)